jgi:hypothetical protein
VKNEKKGSCRGLLDWKLKRSKELKRRKRERLKKRSRRQELSSACHNFEL